MNRFRWIAIACTIMIGTVFGVIFVVLLNRDNIQSAGTPTLIAPIPLDKLQVEKITRINPECRAAINLAPDGNRYICLHRGAKENELWLGSVRYGLEKRLLETGGCVQWFPDSKHILFGTDPRLSDCSRHIHFMDVESGAESEVGYPWDTTQILSDGRVFLRQRNELFVWNPAARKLSGPLLVPAPLGKIAPNGRHFAGIRSEFPHSSTSGRRFLDLTDANGQLVAVIEIGEAGSDSFAWSPDAKYLAFTITPESDRQAQLWIMNADGTNRRQIYKEQYVRYFESLTWMPDGQTLLFFTNGGGTSYNSGFTLKAINISTGTVKKLLEWGSGIRLSADGHKFTFYRDPRVSPDPDAGTFLGELGW